MPIITYQIYDPKSGKIIYENEDLQKAIDQKKSYEKLDKELGITNELRKKTVEYTPMK
jgi:hypothetical protein